PPDAVEYITARHVCHARGADSDQIESFYRDYRVRHPRSDQVYGELEFLYLLSLTGDNIALTRKFLMNNLSVKSGLRAEVLPLFLHGTKLRVEEFRRTLAEVQEQFKQMLIIEQDGDLTKLRTIPEKLDSLAEMADELKLPDPRLGHLFWSLFWYDKLQNHPVEAMWIRKLTRHLLRADSTLITEDQLFVQISNRLFEALLFTIDGCLKTCLFHDIAGLMETAVFVLRDINVQGSDSYQKGLVRLLRKCWEGYSILGSEEILKIILEIDEIPRTEVKIEGTKEAASLEELFFESTLLSPEKRDQLTPDFFRRTYGRVETAKSIADYATTRSAWLALASGSLVDSDVNGFVSALLAGDSSVQDIAKAAFGRINYLSDDSVRLTDVMTLSLSLWCDALRFKPALMSLRLMSAMRVRQESDDGDLLESLRQGWRSFPDFGALIELAETAVLLASELKREAMGQLQRSSGIDYMMNGFSKELCAISLGSVLIASSHLADAGVPLSNTDLDRINNLIKISNDFLDYSLPEVLDIKGLFSIDLCKKVDSLMNLCGIIWNRFGLEQLSDFMKARRMHFNGVCISPDNLPGYNSLIQSIGDVINNQDFSGIMANLAVAETLRPAEELAAHYFIQAADIVLTESFGEHLKDQLCLAAIIESHTYSYKLERFLQRAVVGAAERKSLLRRYLESLPEDRLVGTALVFLNVSHREKGEAAAKTGEIITSFTQGINSPEIKTEVESLLEVFSTEERIKKGEAVDSVELLRAWSNRKHLWLYPWVLNLLMQNGHSSPAVQQEGLSTLDRDADLDGYTTYFNLSLQMAQQFSREKKINGESRITVAYLKAGIGRWGSSLSAEVNVRAYKALHDLDSQNKNHYLSEMQRWVLIKMERDYLKRLPHLVSEKRLFLVFQYYFESMEFWGLKSDISSDELYARIHLAPAEKSRLARDWKAGGATVPPALIKQRPIMVCSAFLTIGSYLFGDPTDQDPTFEVNRIAFNEQARSTIQELFDVIMELPQLPGPIRQLMRSHSERLFNYTLPHD
ncbi:MAG: hypothetical protein ABI923_00665, partial [bacterium]